MPIFALLLVLGADKFPEFAKTFPELKPGQRVEWKGAPIPLYELTQLLGEPPGFPEEAALSKVGRLGTLPGPVALIIRVRRELPAAVEDGLVLFTFDAKGKKVGVRPFASNGASEAGSQTDTVTVGPGGTIDVATKGVVPLHDVPGLVELETSGQSHVRVGIDGSVSVESSRGPDGRFDDPDTREVLMVSRKKVLYRGTFEKPVQELVVSALDPKVGTATVAFPNTKNKLYQLAWSPARDAIACTDPDGKTQTFKRVW